MTKFIIFLVVFCWGITLIQWAWPVFVGLIGLSLLVWLISLVGGRGRFVRRRAAEIEVARQNAASQLDYARREAEGRMWEEFGRHMRGEARMNSTHSQREATGRSS
jgi:hypothetical protein